MVQKIFIMNLSGRPALCLGKGGGFISAEDEYGVSRTGL